MIVGGIRSPPLGLEALEVVDRALALVAPSAGTTRMPVPMASIEPASTACRTPMSAPSGCTSAQANGSVERVLRHGARAPTPTSSTSPPGPTSTSSVRSSPVTGSYSVGGTSTRPSAALDPDQDLLAQAGEEGPDHRTGGPARTGTR